VSPLGNLLLPEPSVYSQPSDFSARSHDVSHAVSYSSSLFIVLKKVNSFAINKIQTLFAKCRGTGWGIPNATTGHPGWGALPRRGQTLGTSRQDSNKAPCAGGVLYGIRGVAYRDASVLLSPRRSVTLLIHSLADYHRLVYLPLESTLPKVCQNKMTLSPFRINTCEKPGGGGAPN
jgi:hypothetical protein